MDLRKILTLNREQIIGEWVHRLHTEVSERYKERPDWLVTNMMQD